MLHFVYLIFFSMLCMVTGLIASDEPVASAKSKLSGFQRTRLKTATLVPPPVTPRPDSVVLRYKAHDEHMAHFTASMRAWKEQEKRDQHTKDEQFRRDLFTPDPYRISNQDMALAGQHAEQLPAKLAQEAKEREARSKEFDAHMACGMAALTAQMAGTIRIDDMEEKQREGERIYAQALADKFKVTLVGSSSTHTIDALPQAMATVVRTIKNDMVARINASLLSDKENLRALVGLNFSVEGLVRRIAYAEYERQFKGSERVSFNEYWNQVKLQIIDNAKARARNVKRDPDKIRQAKVDGRSQEFMQKVGAYSTLPVFMHFIHKERPNTGPLEVECSDLLKSMRAVVQEEGHQIDALPVKKVEAYVDLYAATLNALEHLGKGINTWQEQEKKRQQAQEVARQKEVAQEEAWEVEWQRRCDEHVAQQKREAARAQASIAHGLSMIPKFSGTSQTGLAVVVKQKGSAAVYASSATAAAAAVVAPANVKRVSVAAKPVAVNKKADASDRRSDRSGSDDESGSGSDKSGSGSESDGERDKKVAVAAKSAPLPNRKLAVRDSGSDGESSDSDGERDKGKGGVRSDKDKRVSKAKLDAIINSPILFF